MSGAIVHGRELEGDVELGCDVCVIGSGAAGAVVAAELAEAGQDVIVIEEGAHVPPERYGRMRPSETMRHLWREAGLMFSVPLGDSPMIQVMMGRCVGGSSVLTGGVCFRIPAAVLRTWQTELGLADMSEEALEPCYRAVEQAVHVEQVPLEMRSRSTRLFAQGAEQMGLEIKPLRRNTRGCNGCGRCNFGCPHAAKLSVDIAYLPRAIAAGARLYADCKVDRISHDGRRATGVAARVQRGPDGPRRSSLKVRARRVVVAAGAYATPLLLRDSGLHSPDIGDHLTLHPGFRVMARFEERVDGWKGALQSAYSDSLEREGITLVGLFVPPGVLAATMPGIAGEHALRARSIPHLGVFGGMIHDAAGGTVRRRFGRPVITYRMAPSDRAIVPKLLKTMAEVWFAAGAREVFLPVLGLGGIDADALRKLDLASIPKKQLECASQHPLGTCRMGISPADSVVDPSGKTWELDELYVADGSIVPTSLGVNPQLSIMTLATRIAWNLREKKLS